MKKHDQNSDSGQSAGDWRLPHPEKHLLGELIHLNHALLVSFSREVGVTPARLRLFHSFMHAGPEGIGIIDLAYRLGVTPALVTREVKELEKDGLVKRRHDTNDGRRSIICLSAKGVETISGYHQRAHDYEHALLEGIAEEDVDTAIAVLGKIVDRLKLTRIKGELVLDELPSR